MRALSERARLKIIRELGCLIPGCKGDLVDLHHVRTAANSGTGMKPSNDWIVPLCFDHHKIFHLIGKTTFEKTYRLNLAAEAKKLAKIKTPMP